MKLKLKSRHRGNVARAIVLTQKQSKRVQLQCRKKAHLFCMCVSMSRSFIYLSMIWHIHMYLICSSLQIVHWLFWHSDEHSSDAFRTKSLVDSEHKPFQRLLDLFRAHVCVKGQTVKTFRTTQTDCSIYVLELLFLISIQRDSSYNVHQLTLKTNEKHHITIQSLTKHNYAAF